ncbi:thioredoxin family protein [Marimonas sp. MJW-29]|uniref:Thioredoxin family protein n=1 Tax=Sulfitobacter sediminis TaxID=3234186 RepID=A0ABV3RK44_9RHOB
MSDTNVNLACLSCGQVNRVPAARLAAGPRCPKCKSALLPDEVAEIDIRTHDAAVRSDDLPLIVDYWAPWCGPCRMMAPEIAKAAKALGHRARFAKINTDDFPALSQRLQIRGIPLLILYARGREIARSSGARPSADIEAFVRPHVSH